MQCVVLGYVCTYARAFVCVCVCVCVCLLSQRNECIFFYYVACLNFSCTFESQYPQSEDLTSCQRVNTLLLVISLCGVKADPSLVYTVVNT